MATTEQPHRRHNASAPRDTKRGSWFLLWFALPCCAVGAGMLFWAGYIHHK